MVHDDLLEQIRQPLLDRIDRRLAAILAVSIGAHLTVAILGWLNDPPMTAWLDDPPQAAYSVETIDSIDVPDPTPATAQPGTAAVVPAPKPAPTAPVVPAAVPAKSHQRGTPKAIDPRALVGDLVGHDPSFTAAGRRVGRDLDDQLAAAAERAGHVQVGGGRDQEVELIGDDGGPGVTGVDEVTKTRKPPEIEPPPPDVIIDEPTIPFDDDWLTTGARFHAAQKCYNRSPEYLAGEPAKVRLTMTLGPTGVVIGAVAQGPKGLAACIEARARTWKFPVASSVDVEVHTSYQFVSP